MKYLFAIITSMIILSCTAQKSASKYSEIEYEAGPCFGSCPIYKMTIKSDRTAVLEAEHFNFSKGFTKSEFDKPREGTFTTTISPEAYSKLVAALDDINVMSLNAKYGSRNITDLPTAYLRITMNNGSKKQTEDYGKAGSEKLKQVYKQFEDMKTSQKWTKIK
ncbi:hypothetical protein ASG01_09845 [Chryseobacterium sp. Leaf180]|uniref:DUF6438 domain-containing protein n=1 Tax=Chryseobacterium sp. Leaf180 TaxID=1736289 RepID=UPI0006FD34DE|nr:DUF6438 domain-containing protein [Chryseobacterium sp. Leaf180]KQR93474.1 hypothetical protein ASG01_09845 [Chryseobacterium sp. Leaf180]